MIKYNQKNQSRKAGSVVQTNRKFILAVFFVFTLAAGFGLGRVEKAKAAETTCIATHSNGDIQSGPANNQQECDNFCQNLTDVKSCEFTTQADFESRSVKSDDVCADFSFFSAQSWINCLLLYVLRFLTGLLAIAASLFTWVIDAKNITRVMSNPIIYEMWTLVRDALNIAFILVLLFSAFCTVFQVQKYNYKNILLTLIIMALLVNFSFPIARVIIDFSNVLMYYLIQVLHFQENKGSFFVDIAKSSDLGKIVYQNSTKADTSALIAAVVFTFILAVTLIIIAILFFIRLIVLTILVIFSSVAFVGAIVPFLSSQASKWWDALFKYSFFGPVMIFMIVVATKMMAVIGDQGKIDIQNESFRQSGVSFVANAAFFLVPIIILWIGIGIAQQMSIAGASAVVGRGQKFMASVGRQTYKLPWWGVKTGAKATGVPGGVKQRYEGIKDSFKSSREAREARVAATLGVKGAEEKNMMRQAKELKDNHTSKEQLLAMAQRGNAGAAYVLAEKGDIDTRTYAEAMDKIKNPRIRDLIEGKTREKRADVIIDYKISIERKTESLANKLASDRGVAIDDAIRAEARQLLADQEVGKIAPSKWKDQNMDEFTGFDSNAKTFSLSEESTLRRNAARKAYAKYTGKNQDKTVDDMIGSKYAAGEAAGIW